MLPSQLLGQFWNISLTLDGIERKIGAGKRANSKVGNGWIVGYQHEQQSICLGSTMLLLV